MWTPVRNAEDPNNPVEWVQARYFFHAIFWWDERRSSENLDLMQSGWLKKCLVRPKFPSKGTTEKYLLSILHSHSILLQVGTRDPGDLCCLISSDCHGRVKNFQGWGQVKSFNGFIYCSPAVHRRQMPPEMDMFKRGDKLLSQPFKGLLGISLPRCITWGCDNDLPANIQELQLTSKHWNGSWSEAPCV